MPLDYETPPNFEPRPPRHKQEAAPWWVYIGAIAIIVGVLYVIWWLSGPRSDTRSGPAAPFRLAPVATPGSAQTPGMAAGAKRG
jgi:hypothetical protein